MFFCFFPEAVIDELVKSRKHTFLSFRRKPESSKFNAFWMPDQVRHDDFETFYDAIILAFLKKILEWASCLHLFGLFVR